MLILLPSFLSFLAALTLIFLRFARPNFKYPWLIAVGAATSALVLVFTWQFSLPRSFTFSGWQPLTVFSASPGWLVDQSSWPYALSIAALAAAVTWTSVVRAEKDPVTWSGTLILGGLGILAVTSANPLTLILAWSAIDLAELVTMLRTTVGGEQNQSVVVAFAARLAGTSLVIWASLVAQAGGSTMDFRAIPPAAGIFLLIATGLRLGVLPLHLPYRQENVLRRGFGTTLRLVSAAASLSLLARIPPDSLASPLSPVLISLAALAAIYASWFWLRASDEILGRPFMILGLASLSVAAGLRGNPSGSIGWGVALVLCGGLLFLFSARERGILWLPLIALWGLSTLPFSLTSSAWLTGNQNSWLFILPFLPAQALLMAGFVRQSLHPGEQSLESQVRWTRLLYPTGLIILAGATILLGIWGWVGAHSVGIWWASGLTLILAIGATALALRVIPRLGLPGVSTQWVRILRLEWLYAIITWFYRLFHSFASLVTSALEGEGGVLWSLLLLALIVSILSTIGRSP